MTLSYRIRECANRSPADRTATMNSSNRIASRARIPLSWFLPILLVTLPAAAEPVGTTSTAVTPSVAPRAPETGSARDSSAQAHNDAARLCYEKRDLLCAKNELQKSLERVRDPLVLLHLAEVEEELGDTTNARLHYQACLNEAGDSFKRQAREKIMSRIANLEERGANTTNRPDAGQQGFGRVSIQVNVNDAEVLIDGERVGITPLSAPLELAPADHDLLVRHPGYRPYSERIRVISGQQPPRTITLESVTTAGAKPLGAWIGWSVTAALATSAVVTGVLAISASSAQQDRLERYPVTRRELEDGASKVRTLRDVTGILLIGAGGAAAVSIWLTLPAKHERTAGNRDLVPKQRWSIAVGPLAVRADVSF